MKPIARKKKLILLILLIVPAFSFARLKIEFPVGIDFAEGFYETATDRKDFDVDLWPVAGPFRVQWVFNEGDRWSFAAGAHIGFNPGYSIGATASADCFLHQFQNGTELVLNNTLDFGYLNYVEKYINAVTGENEKKMMPGAMGFYTVRGDFCWKSFRLGVGPQLTFWYADKTWNMHLGGIINLGFKTGF